MFSQLDNSFDQFASFTTSQPQPVEKELFGTVKEMKEVTKIKIRLANEGFGEDLDITEVAEEVAIKFAGVKVEDLITRFTNIEDQKGFLFENKDIIKALSVEDQKMFINFVAETVLE